MSEFAGVILAGGRGQRFGGPKAYALLPDGRTFLEACRDCLRAAGARPIITTLPPGSVPELDGTTAVVLPPAASAMFDSLREGLEAALGAAWEAVVVLPVDHPLVRPETASALAAAAGAVVLPSYRGKHGHPVVLARSVAVAIASGVLAGPTLRDVVRAVGHQDLAVDDPGVGANCNTPEALSASLADRAPGERGGSQ
jgi:molybdenum cofactor cytidylyltransferase